MDYPDFWDKHIAAYKKKKKKKKNIYIYIYTYEKIKYGVRIQVNKTTISGKIVKLEINTNPFHAVRGGKGFLRQTNCRAPRRTPQLNSY